MSIRSCLDNVTRGCGLNLFGFARRRSGLRRRDYIPCFQVAEVLEERSLLSAGALDPTFGSGGVATPTAAINGAAAAIAVYANTPANTAGDVVVAGGIMLSNGNHAFTVVRYTASGKPDVSFGSKGEVTTALKSYDNNYVQEVAIQGDGKIVVAGFAAGMNAKGNSDDFILVRYNVNGSLDTTFGSGGMVTTNFNGSGSSRTASMDTAHALLIQPDGKIVLAGTTCPASATAGRDNSIALVRYNANGTLDTTFGNAGLVITPHTSIPGSLVDPTQGQTQVCDVALQADGKVLVGGYTQVSKSAVGAPATYDVFIARYTSAGTLDASFGTGGIKTLLPIQDSGPLVDKLGELAVENSGEILVTGLGQLAELHSGQAGYSDGSLDTSFGTGGLVTTPYVFGGPVALESSGDIVVSGANWVSGVYTAQVTRLLPGGILDAAFGTGGLVSPVPGLALAVQSDGKIDLAGTGFIVNRLLPGEPQIGLLTASANPVTSGSTLTLTAGNIVDVNPGASVIKVAFYLEDGTGITTLLGYGTQNSPGSWTLALDTTSWRSGTYSLIAQAEDSDDVFGDMFAITETVT